MEAIADHKGRPDADGRIMEATEIAIIDEIASAADLAMGKVSRLPAAIVRGVGWKPGSSRATDLVRPPEEDLFR